MNRITATFDRLKSRGEKALIAYLMAGDPDLERTEELVLAIANAGADLIELGVPFSDPIADGPVIQRAGQRALTHHTSLRDVLALAKSLRRRTEVPLILMTYVNPVSRFGEDRFIAEATAAGIDGVIFPDLPPEEGGEFIGKARPRGLAVILLAAPTSSPARLRMIVRMTDKPVAVGFGVSSPEDAAAVSRAADGVIVGTAIVRLIEERADRPGLLSDVGAFVKSLKEAMTAGSGSHPSGRRRP
jgi:tryptophan synthase alpha chain